MLLRKKLICPEGLEQFSPEELEWRNEAGEEGSGPTSILRTPSLLHRGRSLLSDGRVAAGPTLADIADYIARGYRPHCPGGHELPPEMTSRETIVVGLVGEKGAGKSHYVAMLVDALLEGALAPYDIGVELLSASSERYLNTYGEPLLNHHERLETTLAIEEGYRRAPIVLVLRDHVDNRAFNLVLYDAAGEQMVREEDQAQYNRFLCFADALMLFVTPVALRRLRTEIRQPDGDFFQSLVATQAMFVNLSNAIRKIRGIHEDADIDGVEVRVLLSKADQLLDLPDFDPTLLDELDFDELGLQGVREHLAAENVTVSRFIEEKGGRNLVTVVTHRFPGASFHAVSSTGCNPDDSGRFPRVESMRVVEPLVELLCRRGVLRDGRPF